MAEMRESNSLKVKIDVDCEEALKGLKAITREAKKASAEIKKLEENQPKKVLLIKSKVPLSRESQERIIEQVKAALNNGTALILNDYLDLEWISVPKELNVELTDRC